MRIDNGNKVKKQRGLIGNKAMCGLTGFPIMSYNGKVQYDGIFAGEDVYERAYPPDSLTVTADKMNPPFVRPIKIIYDS